MGYNIITEASIHDEKVINIKHFVEPKGLFKILRIKPSESVIPKIKEIIKSQENNLLDLSKEEVLQGGRSQVSTSIKIKKDYLLQEKYNHEMVGFA